MKVYNYLLIATGISLVNGFVANKTTATMSGKSLATRIPTYFLIGGVGFLASTLFADKYQPEAFRKFNPFN